MTGRWLPIFALAALAFGAGVLCEALFKVARLARPDLPETRIEERIAELYVISNGAEVVMLGDSLTERGMWTELLPDLRIANLAVGGARTVDVVSHFSAIPSSARVAVILSGINDFMAKATVDDVAATYLSGIDELRAKGLRVIVQSTLPATDERLSSSAKELNERLEAACAQGRCIYFNAAAALADDPRHVLAADGIHIRGTAYRTWADALRPIIRTALTQ